MASIPINIFQFEALAKERLSKSGYDFIAGGAADEITLRRTRTVFDSIMVRPRILVDVSQRDLSTTVLGQRIEFPIMLDPAGGHKDAHPDGELASARAAGAMGTAMVLSSGSDYNLEEVAQAANGPIWFQQFLYRDPGLTKSLAQRAEDAGYTALCITLDCTVSGKRERHIQNSYSRPTLPNYAGVELPIYSWALEDIAHGNQGGIQSLIDPSATWATLDWLAANTSLPLVAKGVLTAEDARLCVEHGMKAVIVSNHGARHLDTTFASIEVLPEIVDEVDDKLEIYMDGGIRRGTDVFKALALGARAVLIGRPVFWGLAVDGEVGVRAVLQMLRDELDVAMGQCGRTTIDSIDISLLGTVSPLMSVLLSAQSLKLPQL